MRDKPIIGLLCITLKYLPEYQQLHPRFNDQVNKLGAKLVFFTPYGINWSTSKVRGLVFDGINWGRGESDFPDVIYNRLYGTHPQTIARLAKMIGSEHVFNRINRLDKAEIQQILVNSSLRSYLPETIKYSFAKLQQFINQYHQVILKPPRGHYGLKIFLVRSNGCGYDLFHKSLRKPKLQFNTAASFKKWIDSQEFLIQQWIESTTVNDRYFDVRVLLQKNETGKWTTTAFLSRVARLNYFITNYANEIVDAKELLVKLGLGSQLAKIRLLALSVGNLLDKAQGPFGELSVDFIIETTGKPWIIEVNGKPMKDLFEYYADDDLLAEIYLQPLKYGCYLATKSN